MGRLIDDFKRDMRANNAKFRRDMKANNQQFRERLRVTRDEPKPEPTIRPVDVEAERPKVTPLSKKPKRKKRIIIATITACLVLFVILSVIFAPPSLAVTSSTTPQAEGAYTVSGKITSGDTVTVNGQAAQIAGSTFTAKIDLSEGDNEIKIIAYRGSKKTEKVIRVHRFTSSEVAEQKRQEAEAAAKLKADREAAASSAQSGSGYVNSNGNYVPSPSSNPSGATAKCRDGTYSYSQSRQGTCSHHGGVAEWL